MKTVGFVINKKEFRDNHCIITTLTQNGVIEAIGYGIGYFGSRRSGHLDMPNLCEFEFTKSCQKWIISSCKSTESYANIKQNLAKSLFTLLCLDFLNKNMPMEMYVTGVFEFTAEVLDALEFDHSELSFLKTKFLFCIFKIKILDFLGFIPSKEKLKNYLVGKKGIKDLILDSLNNPFRKLIQLEIQDDIYEEAAFMINSLWASLANVSA